MSILLHRHGLLQRARPAFPGGNVSDNDLLSILRDMATYRHSGGVQAGGTLEINSQALGSYDYRIVRGNVTLTSFTAADWFTVTEDSRSAIIVVVGNLTIDAAVVFTPSVRKLFTALYVTGNLTINGEISMSRRGANHSATGSNIAAQAIRLATGTFGGVSNPQVPAAGGAGGAARTASGTSTSTQAGDNGSAGTGGGCGGGGSGALSKPSSVSYTVTSGAGAAATSFGGGPGGGGIQRNSTGSAGSGGANGGAGGDGSAEGGTTRIGNAGAGNPAGTHGIVGSPTEPNTEDGTGGVLFIAVEGNLLGSGDLTANGASSDPDAFNTGFGGGGSGGGSLTVMCGADASSITPEALGGTAGGSTKGGDGGDGTARILPITQD
jgi:hypothetical protein